MRLIPFLFFLLFVSSCTDSTTVETAELSSILEAIKDEITNCSEYINPNVKVHCQDSTYVIGFEKLNFTKNIYKPSSNLDNSRISYSITKEKDSATVVVTCDYPKVKNLTNEPYTKSFILSKSESIWTVTRKDDLN